VLQERRYGFNGKESDSEFGNQYDYGARIYNAQIGRWLSVDPYAAFYPGISPYVYTLNSPLQYSDNDGGLVVFCHGLLLDDLMRGVLAILRGSELSPTDVSGSSQVWSWDYNSYWGDIDNQFMSKIGDNNAVYTRGHNSNFSTGYDRAAFGVLAAQNLHRQLSAPLDPTNRFGGEPQLQITEGETIKIVGHSQGCAYASGMANELIRLGYTVEIVYYLNPHQPHQIVHPANVPGVQYSHPNDVISSNPSMATIMGIPIDAILAQYNLTFNDMVGGTQLAKIANVTDYRLDIITNDNSVNGDRGGHNAGLHGYIFSIPENRPGHVRRRQDSPGERRSTNRGRGTVQDTMSPNESADPR
jgi:RHS repeat-associated protein